MNDAATIVPAGTTAAIACGGTGGHLFPGLAVGRQLRRRGCAVTLLISSKDIDREAARAAGDMEVVTLPAIGLTKGAGFGFAWRFWQSYRLSKKHFQIRRPGMVLAMGGFTGAPPIAAGKHLGAKTFLHESNSIPGRANRWLARVTDGAFVWFESSRNKMCARRSEVVGMPVRQELTGLVSPAEARAALGLDPAAPVLLVMGGSQGAQKINELALAILPQLLAAIPGLQFIHLTGREDLAKVQSAYASMNCTALVRSFVSEMGLVLAASEAAISRAGASSLAEFAARRIPAVLIPYPTAADDHQFHNAREFVESGAARMLAQQNLAPETLAADVLDLLKNSQRRRAMQLALAAWDMPDAASRIAERMLCWNSGAKNGAPAVDSDPNAPKLGVLNA